MVKKNSFFFLGDFHCLSNVWTYIYNMTVKFETYGQKDGLVGKGIVTKSKDLSEAGDTAQGA